MGGFGRISMSRVKGRKRPPLRNRKRVPGPKFKQRSQVLSPTKVVSGRVIDELTGMFGFRLNNNWRFAIHLSALGAPDTDPPHCVLYSSRGKILAVVHGLEFGFEPFLVLKSKPIYYGDEKGVFAENFVRIWKNIIDFCKDARHPDMMSLVSLGKFTSVPTECLLRGYYEKQDSLDLAFRPVPFDLI